MSETAQFDQSVEQYATYLQSVRGYIRTYVTQANLTPYLPELPGFAVDVGGGTGLDSIFLAERGHNVLLLDPSEPMLALANEAIEKQPEDIANLIQTVQGDVSVAREEFGVDYADIVLDHGVLMYQDSPQDHVNELAAIAGEGGIVSLLTKGYAALEHRLIRDNDHDAVKQLRKTGTWRQNNLGHRVWAHRPEQMFDMFEVAGLDVLDWFGVRLETDRDYRKSAELPPVILESERHRELIASRDVARKAGGQMLHFIGVKR